MNNLPQKPTGSASTPTNIRKMIEGIEKVRPVIAQSGVRVATTTAGTSISTPRRGRAEQTVTPTWL